MIHYDIIRKPGVVGDTLGNTKWWRPHSPGKEDTYMKSVNIYKKCLCCGMKYDIRKQGTKCICGGHLYTVGTVFQKKIKGAAADECKN